jgi:hypothetical protein
MSQEKPQPKYFSRKEFTERLEQTIDKLNQMIAKVNQESLETWPDESIVDNLTQTTLLLEESLVTTPPVPEPTPQKPGSFPEEEEIGVIDQVLPSFNSLEHWWDRVLSSVRSLLPVSSSEKISDWVLTGILTGTVVALLLASVLIFFPNSAPVEEIAQVPPASLETEAIPEVTPPPKLTPEQSLIAALQEALQDLTKQYPEGIVTGIRADFDSSRLIVTIDDGWYELSPTRQDQLADSIWQRSRGLDFKNMEMLSTEQSLVARNPVIGAEAIILERQK